MCGVILLSTATPYCSARGPLKLYFLAAFSHPDFFSLRTNRTALFSGGIRLKPNNRPSVNPLKLTLVYNGEI